MENLVIDQDTNIARPVYHQFGCQRSPTKEDSPRFYLNKVAQKSSLIDFDNEKPLNFTEQQKFKINLNVGQNADWAERLPVLVCGSSATMIQIGIAYEVSNKRGQMYMPLQVFPLISHISTMLSAY